MNASMRPDRDPESDPTNVSCTTGKQVTLYHCNSEDSRFGLIRSPRHALAFLSSSSPTSDTVHTALISTITCL
jgi:hypothetical protein